MSLYIDLQVNNDPIMSIGITRITGVDCRPDSVNTYRWVYYRDQGRKTEGRIEHRYGDGAVALAQKALAAIAAVSTEGDKP